MSGEAKTTAEPSRTANDVASDSQYTNKLSLEGLHNSVAMPPMRAGFWAQWGVFVGPAILVSVGYMDPVSPPPLGHTYP